MSEDVFRWVIAVAVLLACAASVWQAVILAAIFRAGKEAAKAGKEAQGRFGPLVDRFESLLTTSSKILEENRPRVAEIAADIVVVAKTTRQQVERVSEVMDDANARVKARIAQIDETVDQTVVQVEQARDAVKGAVLKPVKEVNGIVAGVKAALNTYAQGGNRNSPEHATQDEEMFI
jgi:methyl-accepting chemotaxis protein